MLPTDAVKGGIIDVFLFNGRDEGESDDNEDSKDEEGRV